VLLQSEQVVDACPGLGIRTTSKLNQRSTGTLRRLGRSPYFTPRRWFARRGKCQLRVLASRVAPPL
jgi:hypothetical protein